MGILVIIIIICVVVLISIKNNQKRPVTVSKDATTYHGYLQSDIITKKAFVMYVMMSVVNLGEKWSQHIIHEGEEIWAKNIIENAFEIVTTNSDSKYIRKGMFNLYKGQELADENKVFMDMFETLIFGSNSFDTNRVDLLSQEEQMRLRLSMHSIHNLLASNDDETIKGKKELAAGYDEVFGA